MRRNRRLLIPFFTVASACRETGTRIVKGDRVAYFPDIRRAYAKHGRHIEQTRALEFASAYDIPDSNY